MIQDFYNKLSEQEKKIFYVAMLVVLFALVDRLFLGPGFAKMQSLDEAIVQKQNSIKRDLRFLSYKDRILNENSALTKYYRKVPKTEEETIAGFLKKIEILATQANVNLIRVTPSEKTQKKGYIEYKANLECNGKLENVVTFMHLIDTSNELIRVAKLSLIPKKGAADEMSGTMIVSKVIIETDGLEPRDQLPQPSGVYDFNEIIQ